MDLKKQQENIIDFIRTYYQEYLKEYGITTDFELTNDFIDFDRFKNDFIVFLEYDSVDFPQSKFNDDCQQMTRIYLNIYLVLRNDTPLNLNDKLLNATSAFGQMINENYVDNFTSAAINKIDFFKYIEGNRNIVSSKIVLNIDN